MIGNTITHEGEIYKIVDRYIGPMIVKKETLDQFSYVRKMEETIAVDYYLLRDYMGNLSSVLCGDLKDLKEFKSK